MSCGQPHEVDCSVVLGQVYEFLDGELDQQAYVLLHQHFEECAPCLGELNLEQSLKALVRRCCGGDCAPDELRAKIMAEISHVQDELRG